MSEPDFDERRENQRVPLTLHVQYTLEDGEIRSGTVQNISKGGVLLVSDVVVPLGTKLEIHFRDPKAERLVHVSGKVIRSAAAGEFGVSFVYMSSEASAFVQSASEGPGLQHL